MTVLSNISARVHIAAAMRAIRFPAGKKHHTQVPAAKWAALRERRNERTQNDAPQCRVYQRPCTIIAAAPVQSQSEQNQDQRNRVPEFHPLHVAAPYVIVNTG